MTVSPRHLSTVCVVSIAEPLVACVARITGWRLRTTARLPDVSTGTTSATVGLALTVNQPVLWAPPPTPVAVSRTSPTLAPTL